MRIEKQAVDVASSFLVVRPTRIAVWTAGSLAVLWYPVRHLYSYHSVVGHIPRFMDHVFGLIAVLATGLLALVFMAGPARKLQASSARLVLLFFLFLGLGVAWVLVHFAFAEGKVGSAELFVYYARALLNYLFIFLIGFYLRVSAWRIPLALGFVLIVLNGVAFVRWDRLMIDLRNIVDPAHSGVYLALSGTALFSGILTWAALSRPAHRAGVLLALVPVLFFMGGRADLAAYVLVFPVALWLTLPPKGQFAVYAMAGVALGAVLVAWGPDILLGSRHAQFLSLDQMTSLIARSRLLEWGVQRIAASPLLGDYGGTLAIRGTIGSYIHNVLNVWQTFGLFAFLLYLSMLAYSTLASTQLLMRRGRNMSRDAQLVVVLVLLATIQVLTAKSFGYTGVALAWGAMAGLLARNEHVGRPASGSARHNNSALGTGES